MTADWDYCIVMSCEEGWTLRLTSFAYITLFGKNGLPIETSIAIVTVVTRLLVST